MKLFGRKKQTDSVSRYSAASGELSYTELRAASWYARHREQVWHVIEICLMAWCVVTVGFSVTYWLYYGAYGYWMDKKAMEDHAATFVNYRALQDMYAPLPLRVSDVRVLRYENGKIDAVAEVENPNEDFVVFVSYVYSADGEELPEQEIILLPKQRGVLSELGLVNTSNASLRLNGERWKRVSSQRIPDPIAYMRDRFNMEVEDVVVEQASGIVPFNSVSFTLTNNSAFGYKEFDCFAVLRSGSVLVGVTPLSIQAFASGASERVDIRQVPGVGEPDTVEIVPKVNVFDASIFLPVVAR